jgi:hypothetical protein
MRRTLSGASFAAIGSTLFRSPVVDHAENRDIGSNSERERENDDAGEGAITLQHAEAETEILTESVERGQASRFALLLLRLGESAKTDKREAARFAGIHAATDIFRDGGINVRQDLGV